MQFHDHSALKGKHATLSPSKPSFLNYTEEDLEQCYCTHWAPAIGTALHEYAQKRIAHYPYTGKMNRYDRNSVMMHLLESKIPADVIDLDRYLPNLINYVNDAIGYRMEPEVVLAYSQDCYGTADAISCRDDILSKKVLRIHDLKTGTTQPKMEQLMVYAALYCLEYEVHPSELTIELRIYQNGEVQECIPDKSDIQAIMQTIVDDCAYYARRRNEL